jgi:hypothetical protein
MYTDPGPPKVEMFSLGPIGEDGDSSGEELAINRSGDTRTASAPGAATLAIGVPTLVAGTSPGHKAGTVRLTESQETDPWEEKFTEPSSPARAVPSKNASTPEAVQVVVEKVEAIRVGVSSVSLSHNEEPQDSDSLVDSSAKAHVGGPFSSSTASSTRATASASAWSRTTPKVEVETPREVTDVDAVDALKSAFGNDKSGSDDDGFGLGLGGAPVRQVPRNRSKMD